MTRKLRVFAAFLLSVGWLFYIPAESSDASCITTAQSIANATTAPEILNTETVTISTDGSTVSSTPVLVQDTCGGDDVSYQIALPTAINFQGDTYTAVYATTNSTIVFGRQDNNYSNFPNTTSISVNAYDWVVLDPNNTNPSNFYPFGWRSEDEHLIITSSQAGFQVDLAVRPFGQNASANTLSTIVVTAAINSDNTLTITYLSDIQQGLNTRTGVRLPDGRVVTLEEAGLTRVYIAPIVTNETITAGLVETTTPTPTPTPEPTPTPTPTPEPAPEPPFINPIPPVVEPEPPVVEPEPPVVADENATDEEKAAIAIELIASLDPGESLTSEQIKEAGLNYSDLPPETPVDVRTDENGNAVIITAEVASNLELLANPTELLATAFTDPGAALAALGSIGADMSPTERKEATDMVVATVVAAGAAMNAVGAAANSTGGSTGGSRSGGGNSGGSGGGGASGESKGVKRRKP